MYLMSTGKQTTVADYYNLQKKCSYAHAEGEETDFRFYPESNIYVEINKKSEINIMRIKERKESVLEVQRIRKYKHDKIYSIACCKQSTTEEIAVGMNNGQVKLFNYKSFDLDCRYNADKLNTVLFVDYNASDEYVSAVYENGIVNIFGRKTRGKVDSLKLDGNSTLARFHPTKRFQLSVASYKGVITIYDMSAKRKIFSSSNIHSAPCRDICMCSGMPDTVITVGYDCAINILDARHNVTPTGLKCVHPLSTVAMSDCGKHFCVGNLKGELITYDMRNLSKYLNSKQVHDSQVNRLAFVPMTTKVDANTTCNESTKSVMTRDNEPSTSSAHVFGEALASHDSEDLRKSVTSAAALKAHRDSFLEFLDYQANKGNEKMSARFSTQRESFDWDNLNRNKRSSEFPDTTSKVDSSVKDDNKSTIPLSACNSQTPRTPPPRSPLARVSSIRGRSASPSPSITNENLMRISEESSQELDKENLDVDHLRTSSGLPNLMTHSSTPTFNVNNVNNMKRRSAPVGMAMVSPVLGPENSNNLLNEIREEMKAEFAEIRYHMSHNLYQGHVSNFKLWRILNDQMEQMREEMACLLQADQFVMEFVRLKEENEKLRDELSSLKKN